MKFTVVWKPPAERLLADLWMESNDKPAISKAANEIDRVLRIEPHEQGESREEGRRIMFIQPLGVSYRILQEESAVEVIAVWKIKDASR